MDCGRHVEARANRHLDVGQQNIRPLLSHELHGLLTVAGSADHVDVALDLQKRSQRAEEHGLVLSQNDANHAERSREVVELADVCGSVMVSVVPGEPSRTTVPPIAAIRSRMPLRPNPSDCEPPRPSSITVSVTRSSLRWSDTLHCRACECRTTLVTASRSASARIASCPGGRDDDSISALSAMPAARAISRAASSSFW